MSHIDSTVGRYTDSAFSYCFRGFVQTRKVKSFMPNGPIRVLMVAPLLPPEYAGGGAQGIALGQRLASLGMQVVALAGTSLKGNNSVYRRDLGQIRTYRVFRAQTSGILENIKYIFRFFVTLLRLARKSDIIHFHGIRLYPIIGIPIAKLLRKRVIGKISLMGTDDPPSLASGAFGVPRLWILKQLDTWLALTTEAVESCISEGIPRSRIKRISNGVDCEKFRPANANEKTAIRARRKLPDMKLVVFAGIISYRKGVDLLVKAIPIVLSEQPSTLFIFVGPSSTSENALVDPELTEKLTELSDDKILVTGFVDDPLDYIRSADIFILPSRAEGLSNAFLEALSSGLPTIVSDQSWLLDIGTNGIHYLKFASGDSEELAACINLLLDDADLRSRLSESARTQIEDGFCLRCIAEEYIHLYKTLLNG